MPLLRADTVITRFNLVAHRQYLWSFSAGANYRGAGSCRTVPILKTEVGLVLQATGDNEQMIRAQVLIPTI